MPVVGLLAVFCAAMLTLYPLPAQGAEQSSHGEASSEDPARPQRNLVGHGGPVRSIAISADGSHALTASFDYSLIYWDVRANRPRILARLLEHEAAVNRAVFLPGGDLALSGSDDGMAILWNLKRGSAVHRFSGHKAKIVDLAVSPDGALAATASWDRTVRLWNLRESKPGPVLRGHEGRVNAVLFAADGKRVYSGSYDGTVRVWDALSGAFIRTLHKHGWGVNVMRLLPDGRRLIFGTQNGDAQVLNLQSGELVKILMPHDGPVLSLAVSPDGKEIATGGGDGVIRVWNTTDWGLVESYQNPTGPIWAMAFYRAGRNVYYAGLDDFVVDWQIKPRANFEPIPGKFPRRFQVRSGMSPGELQFMRRCSVCHTLTPEDGNRAGPTLYRIFGRRAGSLPGYPYSEGLKKSDIIWTEATIAKLFDLGPEHVTPGSKMPLQKIRDKKQRDALIAFLKKKAGSQSGTDLQK